MIQNFFRNPKIVGFLAIILVTANLNRPGITIDEPLDVAPGRHYWDVLFERGFDFFTREGVNDAFGGNPDHPPLARWILGASSHLLETFEILWKGHGDPTQAYILAARFASALAFGFTVAKIAGWASLHISRQSGWFSGFALLLMPRVYGHAHLAALETILNLFCTLTVLTWLELLTLPKVRPMQLSLKASLYLGLSLLTKIQGWLLGPWLLMLTVSNYRNPSIIMRAFLTGAGAIGIWFLGWPWLWFSSGTRLHEYFFRSVDRTPLRVLYFGQIYEDIALPWHYVWVQFFTAIPLGLLLLFVLGCVLTLSCRTHFTGRTQLRWMLLFVFGILTVFSFPVSRYDSDRLFLVIYPVVALVIGISADTLTRMLNQGRLAFLIFTCSCLLSSSVNLLRPFPLSFYNNLTGGLPGAIKMGMEPTYWADTIDPTLLRILAKQQKPGQQASLLPTLHRGQALFSTPYELLQREQMLKDQSDWKNSSLIVVYRREAYWPDGLKQWLEANRPIAIREREGQWLSGIWPGPAGKASNHTSFRTP